jgi:quercetin dioxygenase-like cupin family protein
MAKCRVFSIEEGLKESVKDGLYLKHMFGRGVSVAVMKFVEKNGSALPAKSHWHGEEATLQIKGACSVIEGEGDPSDPEFKVETGDAMIIPVELPHYGTNRFHEEGISLRLNVVYPPRKEYGPEDTVPYYPLKNREQTNA